jgi:hypothetical protein
MKMRGLRNRMMLKRLSFFSPAKILLSKLVHRLMFHYEAQRLGALLLEACQSMLKMNIHQRLPLPLKTVKTQSPRRARGEGHLFQRKILKAQSSRTIGSVGHLLLMLETKSSREIRRIDHLLLLKTKSSRATRSLGRLLLMLKSQSSRTLWGKAGFSIS